MGGSPLPCPDQGQEARGRFSWAALPGIAGGLCPPEVPLARDDPGRGIHRAQASRHPGAAWGVRAIPRGLRRTTTAHSLRATYNALSTWVGRVRELSDWQSMAVLREQAQVN